MDRSPIGSRARAELRAQSSDSSSRQRLRPAWLSTSNPMAEELDGVPIGLGLEGLQPQLLARLVDQRGGDALSSPARKYRQGTDLRLVLVGCFDTDASNRRPDWARPSRRHDPWVTTPRSQVPGRRYRSRASSPSLRHRARWPSQGNKRTPDRVEPGSKVRPASLPSPISRPVGDGSRETDAPRQQPAHHLGVDRGPRSPLVNTTALSFGRVPDDEVLVSGSSPHCQMARRRSVRCPNRAPMRAPRRCVPAARTSVIVPARQ